MKKRLFTAAAGISFTVAWLCAMYTPVYSAVMSIISVIATYEMLKAYEIKNHFFRIFCFISSASVVLYADYKSKLNIPLFPVITAFVLLCLVTMVLDHKRLPFHNVVCGMFSATVIPASLSCVVLFRDIYLLDGKDFAKADGVFFIILAFLCSWATDGFALFAGMAFGKHKLAPEISPKKTVEGAAGGVVGNTLLCMVLYCAFKAKFNLSPTIKMWEVIICAVVLSCISIFGDLAASVVKRNRGIKDFGNILPGHGGIMDRFDSTLFVFPSLYALLVLIYHIQ